MRVYSTSLGRIARKPVLRQRKGKAVVRRRRKASGLPAPHGPKIAGLPNESFGVRGRFRSRFSAQADESVTCLCSTVKPLRVHASRSDRRVNYMTFEYSSLRIAGLFCAIVLAAGCKGGDGSSTSTTATATQGGAAPTINGTAKTSAPVNTAYDFTPTAADPNGDALSFQIQNKPAWATFSTVTGQLSGTPTLAQVGDYANIVISASDGAQSVSLPGFTITVNEGSPNTVTISWVAPTINVDGTAVDLGGFLLAYGTAEDALTQTVRIDNGSISQYVIEDLEPGTYYFGIKAFNSSGVESELSDVISKVVG
jgi:hypothetical protein